jgi:hypothetical protein
MAASVAEGCGDRRRGEAVAAGDAQHPMTACAAGHVRARVTSYCPRLFCNLVETSPRTILHRVICSCGLK